MRAGTSTLRSSADRDSPAFVTYAVRQAQAQEPDAMTGMLAQAGAARLGASQESTAQMIGAATKAMKGFSRARTIAEDCCGAPSRVRSAPEAVGF